MAIPRNSQFHSRTAYRQPGKKTIKCLTCSLAVERLENRVCPSVFYDFDVIAKTGDTIAAGGGAALSGVGRGPSINNSGTVAFEGEFSDGSDSIFVKAGSSAPQEVTASLRNPARSFG